ncbi:MAG: hypothetical protein ACTSXD_02075 [Candidatus Heimdallarchaeaceae archaeon]
MSRELYLDLKLELGTKQRLPSGKTCKDCEHFPRCSNTSSPSMSSQKYCNYKPSRFQKNSCVLNMIDENNEEDSIIIKMC